MLAAVREDHAVMHEYDAKYAAERGDAGASLPRDLVTRVGFQMLAACRVMQFFAEARIPLAPKLASRMIRHLYGSDIHWEARIEPGVMIVHGMGIALSRETKIEREVILFQNVTLGLGFDAARGVSGAPVVERGVHVGAGSTLIGPITIGAGTKVTSNCFLRTSVPPHSLVEAPAPTVSARARVLAPMMAEGLLSPEDGALQAPEAAES
jgi:serine O-acetyltransferase